MQRSEVKMQTYTSPHSWYSLEYPRMWEMEIVENIPAFFDPIWGSGALQVFSVQLGDVEEIPAEIEALPFLRGESLEKKMALFLEAQHAPVSEEDIVLHHKNSVAFIALEYSMEDRFYVVCMFQKKSKFLLALYNCKDRPADEEADNVGRIISSIKID